MEMKVKFYALTCNSNHVMLGAVHNTEYISSDYLQPDMFFDLARLINYLLKVLTQFYIIQTGGAC